MSRSLCKQPVSLIQRHGWKRVGGDRQWGRIHGLGRPHATAAAAEEQTQGTRSRADIPWTAHRESTLKNSVSRPRLSRLRTETNSPPLSSYLTDGFSRMHNYLRISVTERCNLRCVYCMPEEGVPLSPRAHLLTTPEIFYLSQVFVGQGVNKIRITGGEPTVRKDIVDLMRQIGKLRTSGLRELCLTTNGLTLHRKLDSMVEAGLTGVNLSLDTLDPHQFTLMTRRNGHDAVLRSIDRIMEMKKAGAAIKLKINCVVMRGINEREIIPFVELGREKDIETRFIEYMPFDGNKWSQNKMLGFQEMLTMIRERYPTLQKVRDQQNDTSKTYHIPGFVGRMGFITSMTHNFCGTCNRLRITSDGSLKVCLFGNNEVSLRDILREGNDGQPFDQAAADALNQAETAAREELSGHAGTHTILPQQARLLEIVGAAVKRKKAKHAGMGELENMKNRPMILIDNQHRFPTSLGSPAQSVLHASLGHNSVRPFVHPGEASILRSYSSPIGQQRGIRTIAPQIRFRKIEQDGRPGWIYPTQPSAEEKFAKSGSRETRTVLFTAPSPTISRRRWRWQSYPFNHRSGREKETCGASPKRTASSMELPPAGSPQVESTLQLESTTFSNGPPSGVALLDMERPVSHFRPLSQAATRTPRSKGSSTHHHAACTQDSTPDLTRDGEARVVGLTPADQMTRTQRRDGQRGHRPRPGNPAAAEHGRSSAGTGACLPHLSSSGQAHMVDISGKSPTARSAAAQAFVLFSKDGPYKALITQSLSKGDALAVARIAGIQATKKTADLIPLAHPGLGITGAEVGIALLRPAAWDPDGAMGEEGFRFGGVKITAEVSCHGKTGVEMEALMAANTAALAMYDMCKAVDEHMLVTGVQVTMKRGGKNKIWRRQVDIPDDPFRPQIFDDADMPEADSPANRPSSTIGSSSSSSTSSPSPTSPASMIAVPEATPAFFESASQERDLFIANTCYPAKAAEIAVLRRNHQVVTRKITALQQGRYKEIMPPRVDALHLADKITHFLDNNKNTIPDNTSNDTATSPETHLQQQPQPQPQPQHQHQQLQDLRHGYDTLQTLLVERRRIARKVLGWRLGGGSQINEADVEDAPQPDEADLYHLHRNIYHGRNGVSEPAKEEGGAEKGRQSDGGTDESQARVSENGQNGKDAKKNGMEDAKEEKKEDKEDGDMSTIRTMQRREEEWSWRWQGGVYGLHKN